MIVGVPGREGNGRAGPLCSRFVLDALRRFGLPSRPAPGTRPRAEGEADMRDYGIDGFQPSLSERLASGLAALGPFAFFFASSEERRVGKECVRTCRYRGW